MKTSKLWQINYWNSGKNNDINDSMTDALSMYFRNIIVNPVKMIIGSYITSLCGVQGVIIAVALAFILIITNIMGNSINAMTAPFQNHTENDMIIEKYQDFLLALDDSFKEEIEEITIEEGYTKRYINSEHNLHQTNMKDILTLLAVKYHTDLNFTDEEKETAEKLHKLMNKYKTNKKQNSIDINVLGLEDIINSDKINFLGFNETQKEWARDLNKKSIHEIFNDINIDYGLIDDAGIDMGNIVKGTKTRGELLDISKSLIGKVPYFWGGKSKAGYNTEWNKPKLVTAGGSRTSGTMQPYGLDCSGFIGWTYATAGFGNILQGGTTQQWNKSYTITRQQLKTGDLGFKQRPNDAGINHIGIFAGRKNGRNIWIHSAGSTGVIKNDYNFKFYRRANVQFVDD